MSTFATTSGNTKLAPITATVWDLGFVASPVEGLAITFDYIHYAIKNEIESADATKLLEQNSACLLGQLDATSPTCVAAIANVVRDSSGAIVSLYTPKENVAQENVGTLISGLDYKYNAGALGEFGLNVSFTDMLKHTFQQYVGDPVLDYLNDPFYSTEFKTKSNASISWNKHPVGFTVYVERYGRSPNYLSTIFPEAENGKPGNPDCRGKGVMAANQAMPSQSKGAVIVPRSHDSPHEIHNVRRRAWFSRKSRVLMRTRACVVLTSAGLILIVFWRKV